MYSVTTLPAGDNTTLVVESCLNFGTIEGDRDVGGIIGLYSLEVAVKISNCINHGFIKGDRSIGGIVGGFG